MAFLETPRFPVDLQYGSQTGPSFNTDVVTTGNGVEFRNANWSLPLFRFNAAYSVKTRTEMREIYEFFLAQQGRLGGFRVKDQWDFTSAANNFGTPAQTDQTIGTGDGAETVFQIIKTYIQGAGTLVRDIKKPINTTLLVEVNTVLQTETTNYTVDYTTGIITFIVAPPNTHVIKTGYEFDVPCRFDSDDLSSISFSLSASAGSTSDIVNIGDIPLIEIRT